VSLLSRLPSHVREYLCCGRILVKNARGVFVNASLVPVDFHEESLRKELLAEADRKDTCFASLGRKWEEMSDGAAYRYAADCV